MRFTLVEATYLSLDVALQGHFEAKLITVHVSVARPGHVHMRMLLS